MTNDIISDIINTVIENVECQLQDVCIGCGMNACAYAEIEDKEKLKGLIKKILEDSEEIKVRIMTEKICDDCGSKLDKYVMYKCPKCDEK